MLNRFIYPISIYTTNDNSYKININVFFQYDSYQYKNVTKGARHVQYEVQKTIYSVNLYFDINCVPVNHDFKLEIIKRQ
jgi:hypothetical protein